MSLSSGLKPLNAFSLITPANFSTAPAAHRQNLPIVLALFLLACTATLTIWNTRPLWAQLYECSTLLMAAWLLVSRAMPISRRWGVVLCALPAVGFLQITLGATEHRPSTLQVTLQLAALSATAWIACSVAKQFLEPLLEALAWFGFLMSIMSVLAYYTSPGQILWTFESPYPDTWGPFLSRNNFAQFLELTLPIALWQALYRPNPLLSWAMAATMLAAGLVSASRAGALLLCLVTLAAFLFAPRALRKFAVLFVLTAGTFAALSGASTLLHRFTSDPFVQRDQIYRSTLAMIRERPWTGYGLGTFSLVYPEFALFDSGYSIDHAHNDWLEWTSEGGLAFPALWAVLFLPPLARLRMHPWALGIPAVLLHALVDFPFARLGIAAWIFILLGLLECRPRPHLRRTT